MSKPLTILITPSQGMGHLNPSIGLGEELLRRGHNVVFLINEEFKEMITRYGFNVEVINTIKVNDNQNHTGDSYVTLMLKYGVLSSHSSIDKLKIHLQTIKSYSDGWREDELETLSILNKHKPDIIIIDQLCTQRTLRNTGKPWVNFWSCNPLVIDNEMTPPMCSGYPTDGDRNLWIEFRELKPKLYSGIYLYHMFSNRYQRVRYEYTVCELLCIDLENNLENNETIESPFLNIYNYPKELDYTDIRPLPHNWFAVDSFIRKGEEPFELPVQLKGWKGKLIYLSLGSMGSINTELMKRLVNILSKSKHKFIVSKGLFGDKYELADNMWGQRSVPQTKVLPLVDLVLTHGGNNTVTESIYFGKPMIVLPILLDQFDNAQRVHEKGFGVRIDPYLCSEEELLNSIEMLLNNNLLNEKLYLVSKQMQSSDSLKRACLKIEELVN